MRKIFALLFTGAIAVSAIVLAQPPPGGMGFGGRGRGPGGPGGRGGPQAVVTGAPYSAVQTISATQTLSDGTKIAHNDSSKIYRDSQGRVHTDITLNPPPGSTEQARVMVTIFDPVAGTISRLDPQAMTVDTTKLLTPPAGATPPQPPPPPEGASVQTQDLGSKSINGLNATGTRTTITFPAGTFGNSQAIQSVHEVWISTDLKVPVLVTDSDPRHGTSTMQLTNVLRTEPDPSLFVVPSNYTVSTHTRPGGRRGN